MMPGGEGDHPACTERAARRKAGETPRPREARGLAWGNQRFPRRPRALRAWPHEAGGVRLVRIPPRQDAAAKGRDPQ